MNDNSNCIGCKTNNICDKQEQTDLYKCPCSICLIKGVCNNSCEDYREFQFNVVMEYSRFDTSNFQESKIEWKVIQINSVKDVK